MKKLRVAFMGFRHGHIRAVHQSLQNRADAEIVAACEEDQATYAQLLAEGKIHLTHDNFERMLDETDADIIAIGDYYGRRGALSIKALENDKHIISDKPICTSLMELDTIERLARDRGRAVGCQFSMRDNALTIAARRAIQAGEIGETHAVAFGGQHPLLYGTRPNWYFEPGKHGGTINDIAIHAFNCIPRITGQKFAMLNCAREWNTCRQEPAFKNAAQMMLTMDNGCGVLGDVSYLMPDSFGYTHPLYWHFTFWGSDGILEMALADKHITIYKNGAKEPCRINAPEAQAAQYLESFLNEIKGAGKPDELCSSEVLASSRTALLIQKCADQSLTNQPLTQAAGSG